MLKQSSWCPERGWAICHHILTGITWAVTLSYPFLVWYFLDYFEPRFLALMLASLFLLRFLSRGAGSSASATSMPIVLACVLFLAAVALVNETMWLMAYPVFVSLLFFTVFSYSLVFPPTIVERLARLHDPNLPPKGVAYTRKVTQVWSGFFLCNAAVSLATVWYGDQWLWSLYNGCVFYVLMGLLMAGEMMVRRKVRASY
ncbi:MAG: hypothetical protein ACXV7J_14450 [Methylomonas sp.]